MLLFDPKHLQMSDQSEVGSWTVKKLQQELRKRNLATSGSKKVLVSKIVFVTHPEPTTILITLEASFFQTKLPF